MNAESTDPRSTRKKPGKSWGAAFTSHDEIHWKMLKNTLNNHCKIDEKSMKKRVDFWTDLLIDFYRFLEGFREPFRLSKSMKNPLEK